jgi:hypothetical protein
MLMVMLAVAVVAMAGSRVNPEGDYATSLFGANATLLLGAYIRKVDNVSYVN